MKKTTLNTALWTALAITLSVGVSACSGEKEDAGADSGKVMAVDRVDEAAEIARKNGPEAEDMAFEQTAPVATADTTTTEANTAAEGDNRATTDEATATADMTEGEDSTATDKSVTDTAEQPNADKTAADGLQ